MLRKPFAGFQKCQIRDCLLPSLRLPDKKGLIRSLGSISSSQQEHQPRLLVIDDNADMRDYLSRLLSPTYDIHVAANGSVALPWLGSFPLI